MMRRERETARILVFGSTGMLGHMLLKILAQQGSFEVDGAHRLDHTGPLSYDAEQGAEGLRALLGRRGPYDYVINALGIIRSRIDPHDPRSIHRAIVANAVFPHVLASVAAESQTRVIHVSTDCVFSGKGSPYDEDAPHDCLDVYGKTKSLGEIFEPGTLTIRCSLIGPDPMGRRGLLEWLLSQPSGATVPGFVDHFWNGATTLQFAMLCAGIIGGGHFERIRDESPVHHFCPTTPVSKYELLERMKSVFQRSVTIVPSRGGSDPVKRILTTRYRNLASFIGGPCDVEEALRALAARPVSQQEAITR